MLKRVGKIADISTHAVRIADALFPQIFPPELEFNAPARGMWNIVHTGMLIPRSHQIFICAQGCLRGVILTAAEMNAMERMSFGTVRENDLFDGTLESNVVECVSGILDQMAVKPPAVLVFLSCIQLFAGCDTEAIYDELRCRYPDIDFIECLMHPTMRKSGLTPDQFMRKQLYAPLKSSAADSRTVGLIGNDRITDGESELIVQLQKHGFEIRDIADCSTYEEYLKLADCEYFISYYPTARAANGDLSSRLQRKSLHLPLSYSFDEIADNYTELENMLNIKMDCQADKLAAERALADALKVLKNMPIAIDYTATLRTLSLARLLLDKGFNVQRVYSDVFIGEETADFEYLQAHYPDLLIYPTLHPAMRFAVAEPGRGDDFLAIGQKAACYTGSRHLVNIVSGGGWYGFRGIEKMGKALVEAYNHVCDTEKVIQLKGWGCESCL